MGMLLAWVGFHLFVLIMLALDLGVFHRKSHIVSIREATIWSLVWVSLAGLFNLVLLYFWQDIAPDSLYSNHEAAMAFLTGYLIEKSLSIDNIFVFVLIFASFAVPAYYQHRVLFWGITGALLMRGIMIVLGVSLIETFHWILYIFGAFLVFSGIKMAFHDNSDVNPQNNLLLRITRRFVPVTRTFRQDRFFVWRNGVFAVTPLLLVLLVVESSDLMFAVDSIPAIFAITHEPFLIYTSNIFAILGLRSLYFVLAGMLHSFHYLKLGLAVVLTFVGVKMLLADTMLKIPMPVALLVIVGVIAFAIGASLFRRPVEAIHGEGTQTLFDR